MVLPGSPGGRVGHRRPFPLQPELTQLGLFWFLQPELTQLGLFWFLQPELTQLGLFLFLAAPAGVERAMRAVMISDAHLEGPDDPKQRALLRFLERIECDRLFVLGDLFHHWWGFPDQVMPPYAPVVDALEALDRRGVALTYVPGNHDFALGEAIKARVALDVRGPHVCMLDGVGYLLAHGDEADTSLQYQLFRRLIRGRAFDAVMRALGPARAWDVLRRIAGASRAAPADVAPLLEAQRAWAAPQLGEQASVAVMGHLHVAGVVPVDTGVVVHLGDWISHRSFLVVEEGRGQLRTADTEGRWTDEILGEVGPVVGP